MRLFGVIPLLIALRTTIIFTPFVHGYTLLSQKALKALSSLSKPERLTVDGEFLKPFLVPRPPGSPGSLQVQQFIISTFRSLGWDVEEDSFTWDTIVGPKSFNNIIVTKNINASRRLILAAHFDSKILPDIEFIGATDSAVPCAILVDLATSLNSLLETSPRTNTTLQIIFFDGEEAFKDWTETDSIYGARHLADKWEKTFIPRSDFKHDKGASMLDGIDVMVLLDLLGSHGLKIQNWFISTSWLYKHAVRLEEALWQIGHLTVDNDGLAHERYFNNESAMHQWGTWIGDDHVPFMQRGVHILHLIAYPFPPVWHKSLDDASAIDHHQVNNLATILRVLVAEYLDIQVVDDSTTHAELG